MGLCFPFSVLRCGGSQEVVALWLGEGVKVYWVPLFWGEEWEDGLCHGTMASFCPDLPCFSYPIRDLQLLRGLTFTFWPLNQYLSQILEKQGVTRLKLPGVHVYIWVCHVHEDGPPPATGPLIPAIAVSIGMWL